MPEKLLRFSESAFGSNKFQLRQAKFHTTGHFYFTQRRHARNALIFTAFFLHRCVRGVVA